MCLSTPADQHESSLSVAAGLYPDMWSAAQDLPRSLLRRLGNHLRVAAVDLRLRFNLILQRPALTSSELGGFSFLAIASSMVELLGV